MRCPVCGKTDWCLIRIGLGGELLSAICPRVESPRRWSDAGYLHEFTSTPGTPRIPRRAIRVSIGRDFEPLAGQLRDAVEPDDLHAFARDLGVSTQSLRLLGIGWVSGPALVQLGVKHASHAWSFPMFDHRGRTIGIRLRLPNGRKLAVKGSKNGLFIPSGSPVAGSIFIAEGESDTAALLTMGVYAIGRPGARQCVRALQRHLLGQRVGQVVVVADNDAVGGQGAAELVEGLKARGAAVRLIRTPEKDVRRWLQTGATRVDLDQLVDTARADSGGGHE
ncbi:hypothetical protein Poly30_27700 [Planctomycetes bacterium Poly30]|uniref:Toprim domain-containing protein n=1 Tax=Saltatorellus ferox TaxID=2528018 RepID=A0A518ET28_9BACT|nr:hypothetical protein Poly30_27700 [Planctomycetes bacterium Poly30]